MDLSKYLPINTQEKVDTLLSEIETTHDFDKLELSILFEIRKPVIQIYLKNKISQLRQSGKIRLVVKNISEPDKTKQVQRNNSSKTNQPKKLDNLLAVSKPSRQVLPKKTVAATKLVPGNSAQEDIIFEYKGQLVGKSIDQVALHFGESTRSLQEWIAKYGIKVTSGTIISEHMCKVAIRELVNMITIFKRKKKESMGDAPERSFFVI